MIDAPVNVFLSEPTDVIEKWNIQKMRWERLNQDVAGNQQFYPLTVKAFYVFGVLLAIFKSVEILLEEGKLPHITYIPAYSLFASGIDILGRCIRGNKRVRGSTQDIKVGFRWLAKPSYNEYLDVPDTYELVKTINGPYSISQLTSMRHFATHGQATSSEHLPKLDYLILAEMPSKIARALESYWACLQKSGSACNLLARANIMPYRNRPIFDALWSISDQGTGDYPALGDLFGSLDWTYKYKRF